MKNIPYDSFLESLLHFVANDQSLYNVLEIQNTN